MSGRTIIIECGAAQTRAALVENEIVTRFWFGPARGDECGETAPGPGVQYIGRVTSVDKARGAVFVDIGLREAGFLQMRATVAPPKEGALIRVKVKRAARGRKGATLGFLGAAEFGDAVGPLAPPRDAVLQALSYLGEQGSIDEVIIDSGAAKAVLDAFAGAEEIGTVTHDSGSLFAGHGGADALDDAFLRKLFLPGGGAIIIDEAEALTAIDVDSGDAARGDSKRIGRVNIEAVRAATQQLRRRDLGGQIVIDFLREGQAGRSMLNDELKKCFPAAQKAGWTKSGLFAFALPRPYPSLLDRFTEEAPGDPLSGRRFTLDWIAKDALRAAERLLKASGAGRVKLAAGPALYAYFNVRAHWTDRLNERYGARLSIVEDQKREDRGYDLCE